MERNLRHLLLTQDTLNISFYKVVQALYIYYEYDIMVNKKIKKKLRVYVFLRSLYQRHTIPVFLFSFPLMRNRV